MQSARGRSGRRSRGWGRSLGLESESSPVPPTCEDSACLTCVKAWTWGGFQVNQSPGHPHVQVKPSPFSDRACALGSVVVRAYVTPLPFLCLAALLTT